MPISCTRNVSWPYQAPPRYCQQNHGTDRKQPQDATEILSFPVLIFLIIIQLGLITRYYCFQDKDESQSTRQLPCPLAAKTKADDSNILLAHKESLGFFDDISQREWQLMKDKVASIYPNTYRRLPYSELRFKSRLPANHFFQEQFEPNFYCRHERRMGRQGDGGKWVCDPHRIQNAKNCLVYSVGSNDDVSFEQAVKSEIGSHCEIHSFDMAKYTEVVEQTLGFGPQFTTMTLRPVFPAATSNCLQHGSTLCGYGCTSLHHPHSSVVLGLLHFLFLI
jgi:Methyltransferase domain